MKKWNAGAVLLLPLVLAGCAQRAVVYAGPPPPAVDQVAQQGYHDGFEAARHDVESQRRPDFNAHPRFRNPPVPPPAFHDYREAFRSGYEAFLHQGPPPPRY